MHGDSMLRQGNLTKMMETTSLFMNVGSMAIRSWLLELSRVRKVEKRAPVKVRVVRRFDFSSSHRYYREDWSEEKNSQEFGLCALPNGHGHNFILEVTVMGSPDPLTGMVINLADMREAVNVVLSEFDHRNLNLDTPYFKTTVPTTENFVLLLWDLIESALRDWSLERLRLYESDDLFVEYAGVPV